MILKSLILENIRSYTNVEIQFPEGSLLLSGDVGSGKSTVLLAVDFALFGIQKNLLGASLLRHGRNFGSVELTFEIDGKEITIKRTLRRKVDSVRQDTGFIVSGGLKKELTASEAKSFIINLLGYPEEAVRKDKSLIYRYTVYTPQEQMQAIMRGDKDERLDIMRRVFGIDKYKRVQENAEVFVKELRGRIREIQGSIGDLEDKKKARMAILEEKKEFEKQLKELEISLGEQKEGVEKKRKELTDLQEKSQVFQKKRERYSALRSEFGALKERSENVKSDVIDLQSKLEALEKKITEFGALKPPTDLNTEQLRRKIGLDDDKSKRVLEDHASLSREIYSLSEILEKGICGTCKQRVANPALFKEGIEKKKREADKLKTELEKVSGEIRKNRKLLDELQAYYMKSNESKILEERKADMLESEKRYDAESKQLRAKMAPIYEELKKLVAELKEEGTISQDSKKKQEELEVLKEKQNSIEKAIVGLKQRVSDADDRVSELDMEIKKKTEDQKRIDEFKTMERWLTEFFVNLMATIEKHVMANIQYEFNSFFQKWFSMLVNDENLQVRIDDEFSPIVEQNGFETDYNFLSGGERTAIALAYRLALNKVTNDLIEKIKTKDLLILDEPTDGFSTEQMNSVRDVLDELGNRQTIIVSHEPKIDSFVDNTYRFVKENNVSRTVTNF